MASPAPRRRRPRLLAGPLLLALAGCAYHPPELAPLVRRQTETMVRQAQARPSADQPALVERGADLIRTRAVQTSPEAGEVSVSAAAPLGALLTGIARDYGYAVSFSEGLNLSREVAVNLRGLTPEAVLRRVAMAGGAVAVIDRTAHTVSVAESACFTYRLPLHVMQRLQALFTVGGNPVTAAPGSTGSAQAPASTGGAPVAAGPGQGSGAGLQASFTVSGRYQTDAQAVGGFLQQLAGRNAEVSVMADLGLITVRSNAAALARVSTFLNKFSANAMRRVEIEASIVEVSLTQDFQYGIQWSRILGGRESGTARLGDTSLVTGATSVDVSVATAGISSILQALQAHTSVRVLSQPRVLALNNTPSVLFDGQQLPYLGSVASTSIPGAGGASTTTSGAASYAVDGVTLSIQPDILSDTEVQLTIIPVLSSVQEFQSFDLGSGSRITAPVQRSNQSLMQVVAESGRTLIMGGIRSSSGSLKRGGLPGMAGTAEGGGLPTAQAASDTARELVILMRARVLPGGAYDALFSEAL